MFLFTTKIIFTSCGIQIIVFVYIDNVTNHCFNKIYVIYWMGLLEVIFICSNPIISGCNSYCADRKTGANIQQIHISPAIWRILHPAFKSQAPFSSWRRRTSENREWALQKFLAKLAQQFNTKDLNSFAEGEQFFPSGR